jgi:DNA-directed RNA polymerase subunit M/transcription elongation factor TFIIS
MKKITNSQVFRENIQTKISGILDVPDDSVSINLEKGVFNYALKEATRKKIVKKWENPQFTSIYIDRLRSIYMNLKNDVFLKQIRSGEIDSKSVGFMTHQEFNPEKWHVLIEKKMKRDASKYDDNIQASTDMYTCRKCKSKRCTYYEMQTRSADEPATIFVTCLDCGKHWRS